MIGIGINENVFLEKVTLDEKNSLILGFQETNVKDKPASPFAGLTEDEVVETMTGLEVRLFPPLPPTKTDMTEEKKVDLLTADINKTKGVLLHILKGYLTSDQLKGLWKETFAGLNMTADTYPQEIQKKEVLLHVHKNMARIFMDQIKPFLNDKSRAFRLLLVRQSKDKAYASFRGRFIEDNPFWESMEVPKEASKLKFTDYEKREGLDNASAPVAKDVADKKDATGGSAAAPLTAQNVFGG